MAVCDTRCRNVSIFPKDGLLSETVIESVEIKQNRIAERIAQLKLTQDAAAHRTGLPLRQLQRAMQGTHSPRLETAKQIAEGLDSSIEDLFVFRVYRKRIHSERK